jgi:hypothetical protein
MANTKLLKVMDYLINEQEDKAKELLHQIFIEKARAIHEEMMRGESEMDEADLGGDMGRKLADEIEADADEIESEEHYSPMEASHDDLMDDDMDVEDAEEDLSDELEDATDDEDVDMDDELEVDVSMDDEDADMDDELEVDADMDTDADHEGEDEKIHDLEQAIAELKAEFDALKGEVEGDDASSDHGDEDEVKVDEAWKDTTDDLDEEDEDYDGLDENIDLETVQAARSGEVGSGKFAPAETNKHSPVPPTQTDMMGARAVKTGAGAKASGYDRERAPESKSMGLSNRRKDADAGKYPVSKEGNSSALLNKGASNGFGAANTKSPIRGNK